MEKIDALNREEFVNNLIKIIYGLTKTKKTASIAMNGQWGCGKSFVLNMLEEKLSVFHSSQADTDGKYFVFHYNCWQYDYYDEPIMAIVSALQDTIKEYNVLQDAKYADYTEKFYAISRVVLEIGRQIALNKLGIDFGELYKAYQDNNSKEYFDEYIFLTEAVKNLKESLSDIAKDCPILLVVDELDRCLPEYAIKVLERLHHIFYGVENIVVLMAYDENQITHTVEEIFGQGTDVNNYLRKFVDYKLELDKGSGGDNVFENFAFYFDRFNIEDRVVLLELFRNVFCDLPIRETEKVIERINLIDTISDLPIRNERICAAQLIYIALEELLSPEQDFVEYIYRMKSYTRDEVLRRKVESENKQRFNGLISLVHKAINRNNRVAGFRGIFFHNNIVGNAMVMIAKLYDEKLLEKDCDVRFYKESVNLEELECFKKFVVNVGLVL